MPEMFILSIYLSTISMWTNTSNVESFIDLNNSIWIDALCTQPSKNDIYPTNNIIWTDMSYM